RAGLRRDSCRAASARRLRRHRRGARSGLPRAGARASRRGARRSTRSRLRRGRRARGGRTTGGARRDRRPAGWLRMPVDLERPWADIVRGDELAYLTTIPPREPRATPIPADVHDKVREALARQGIDELYVHQAAAWEAACRSEHVIVTTGTASGKTLAFNLPVLDALAREPKNRALYLYPTKALAQDQARALGELAVPRVRAAIYDGDTPPERRWQIRKWANLVLTNPDMLHIGVLPRHDLWADVLHNLRYV